MPTLEEVRAEKERRKAAQAVAPAAPAMQGAITLDAIRAEKARRQQQPPAPVAPQAGQQPANWMAKVGENAQRQALVAQSDAIRQGKVDQVSQNRPYASVDDAINDAAQQYQDNLSRSLPDGYEFVKGAGNGFDPQSNKTFLRGPDGMLWTPDKWEEAIRAGLHGQLREGQGQVEKLRPTVEFLNKNPAINDLANAYTIQVKPILAAGDKAIYDAGAAAGDVIDNAPSRISEALGGGPRLKISEGLSQNAPAVGNFVAGLAAPVDQTIPGAGEFARGLGEGLTQWGATTARNPAQGGYEALDMIEPTHITVEGVMENDPVKTLMGVAGLLPGTSAVGDAAVNAMKAPSRALEANMARIAPEVRPPSTGSFGATQSFAKPPPRPVAPVEPPPVTPTGNSLPPAQPSVAPVAQPPTGAGMGQTPKPFSMPPQAPTKGNLVARNADRIVGGAVGAFVGGGGDAFAESGDGSGDGGPTGAVVGGLAGALAPRAVRHGLGRVSNKFGASEAVAARAVRNALKSAGINSLDDALAHGVGRFGDKPATIADLSQEGVSLGTGISRLPGVAGPQARARYDDLLDARPGRLERDIGQAAPNLNPATISGDIEALAKEAQAQAKPAYDALRAQYQVVTSPRLDQLKETSVLKPHVDAVERYRQNQLATDNRHVGDFEFWDLVKRDMDAKEQQLIAKGATMSDIRLREIEDARTALVAELDHLVPQYPAARELGGVAPILKSDYAQGQKLLGGQYRAEDVQRLIEGATGRPLTGVQAGVIRSMVQKTDGPRGAMAALMSARNQSILREVFGADVAEQLQRRFAADAAIVQNASRMNPNVGSATSQAQMGAGTGILPMVAGAVKTVRSPMEAALAAMSKSGAYNQATRDLIWEMLSGDITRENLERIFRSPTPRAPRGPRGPRGGPSAPTTPPTPRGPIVSNGFGGRPAANGVGGKSLPMDEASRLGRAKAMGFDVDTPLYHGTGRDFDAFDANKGGGARSETGVWLTNSPERASGYAPRVHHKTGEGGGHVVPVYIRGDNILEIDAHGANWNRLGDKEVGHLDLPYPIDDGYDTNEIARWARQQGYDGVRFKNVRDRGAYAETSEASPADTVVIFDPANIRGKFAAFDPAQEGSSKLLAGISDSGFASPTAMATLGGGAVGYMNPVDANGDGVISDAERLSTAAGAAFGTGASFAMARSAFGHARGNKAKPPRAMEPPKAKPAPELQAVDPVIREKARADGFDVEAPLYHGTANNFPEFDPSLRGGSFKDPDSRQAIFLTTSPRVGGGYATEAAWGKANKLVQADPEYKAAMDERIAARNGRRTPSKKWHAANDKIKAIKARYDHSAGATIMPAYVRLKNPLIVTHLSDYERQAFNDIIREAKANGHDGVIFKSIRDNAGDAAARDRSDVYAVFDGKNVRRASAYAEAPKPPATMGFGGKPKGPPAPTNAKGPPGTTLGPPKKAEEIALRAALSKAKANETKVRRDTVMRDNRDELRRPAEEAVMQAQRNLNDYMERQYQQAANAARWQDRGSVAIGAAKKAGKATKNFLMEQTSKNEYELAKTVGLAGGAAIGAGALYVAAGGGQGKKQPKAEKYAPTDPEYTSWKMTQDKAQASAVQYALAKLGLLSTDDADGTWGTHSRDALAAWLSRQPNRSEKLPAQDYDFKAILAEADGGRQEGSKWLYADGTEIVWPPKRSDTYVPYRPLTEAETRYKRYYDKKAANGEPNRR